MQTTTLNPIQKHLLQMFSYLSSESMLDEVKSVLLRYYSSKMQKDIDKYWEENHNKGGGANWGGGVYINADGSTSSQVAFLYNDVILNSTTRNIRVGGKCSNTSSRIFGNLYGSRSIATSSWGDKQLYGNVQYGDAISDLFATTTSTATSLGNIFSPSSDLSR